MDCERVARVFSTLDVEIGCLLDVFADVMDLGNSCHFDRKMMLTALFAMKGIRGIVYEGEMEASELAFHELNGFVAKILRSEEVKLYGINETDRKLCEVMEAFERDDPFLQGNFVIETPFTDFVELIIEDVVIPGGFETILHEISDHKR
jgi:hypothetical protein